MSTIIVQTESQAVAYDPRRCDLRQAESDEQLIKMWLTLQRSEQTRRNYEPRAKRFVEWLTPKALQQVTLADLQNYFEGRFDALASDSQRFEIMVVKSLFSFASDLGYIGLNPAAVIRVPPQRNVRRSRIISEEVVGKALKKEKCPRSFALVLFLYGSGCRIDEALHVLWEDVYREKDNCWIYFRKAKRDEPRDATIPVVAWESLQEISGPHHPTKPVFNFSYSTANRIVHAAFKRAGYPKVSCHYLRHAHCTHARENGAPWEAICQQVGHKDMSITHRIYTHLENVKGSALYLNL
jgi:integrase/recombinase XerD